MSKYSLIVFDWDGTLIDSKKKIVECMQFAISSLNHPKRSDKEVGDIIGLGLDEAVAALYPDFSVSSVKELAQVYRETSLTQENKSQLFEGVKDVLISLKNDGYDLAVATGKSRRGLDKDLIDTGLIEFFPITRCADETRSKPNPQMMEEILVDYNTEKEKTLMIGDSTYDLQLANNAKVDALAVSYGVHGLLRLLKESPVGFIDDIKQLPKWLVDHS